MRVNDREGVCHSLDDGHIPQIYQGNYRLHLDYIETGNIPEVILEDMMNVFT